METPEGNLVAGMQWLQATYANRFNKLRAEHGHLFQGRYKALLVEEGEALGRVCHYLHLNPVRAGILPVERLKEYRYSSYWYLWRPKVRVAFLKLSTAMEDAGGLADTAAGRRCYANYLAWQAQEGPMGRSRAYACLSEGWALGTREFKAALIKDHALAATARAWERGGADEIRTTGWEQALRRALRTLRRAEVELGEGRKSAAWKVALAAHLKESTQVSNRWLAQRLGFGRAAYASRLVSASRRRKPSQELVKLRAKCTT